MENEGNNVARLEEDYKKYLLETPREALTKKERKLRTKLMAAAALQRLGLASANEVPRIKLTKRAKKHATEMQKVHAKIARIRRIGELAGEAKFRAMTKYAKWRAREKAKKGPPRAKNTRRRNSKPGLLSVTSRRASQRQRVEERRRITSRALRARMSAISEEHNNNANSRNSNNSMGELQSKMAGTKIGSKNKNNNL